VTPVARTASTASEMTDLSFWHDMDACKLQSVYQHTSHINQSKSEQQKSYPITEKVPW